MMVYCLVDHSADSMAAMKVVMLVGTMVARSADH